MTRSATACLSRGKRRGAAPVATASTYDTRDRLLTRGPDTAYSWDANGNLQTQAETATGTTTYTWDFEDRLIRVTHPDGSQVRTDYDVDGHRVSTTILHPDGTELGTTHYLVDTSGFLSHVVAETDASGQVLVTYTRSEDRLLALHTPESRRTYHADGLGSIRLLADDTATVTDRYTYTAFGELIDHTGPSPQPYRFAAEPFDANVGFSYNRARWLDLAVGRFVSMDPWEGEDLRPHSLHRYLYAGQSPVGAIDPTGESEFSVAGLVGAVAIGAVAYGGFSFAIYRDFARALNDALVGALVGATFYAALPTAAAAIWRVAPLAGGSVAVSSAGAGGVTTLYRAMSNAEFQQLMTTGQFHAGPNSLGGKWMAETLPHALRWGRVLEGATFRVVEIQVRSSAAGSFLRTPRLDGIGPARYAELHQINSAIVKISEVVH